MNSLQEIIDSSNKIVFFGGAGVSTESGIPDFHSKKKENINMKKSAEKILSHSYFEQHTEEFFQYYKKNLLFIDAKPNKAHTTLAKLEKIGKLKAVITQNVDGLHQKAGSKNVLELHGNIFKNHCQVCRKEYMPNYILESEGIPRCECGGLIKPGVVLYEEPLNSINLTLASYYIEMADTLIVAGSSLTVHPAANLIEFYDGDNFVLINKSSTHLDSYADILINEPIGETLGKINI